MEATLVLEALNRDLGPRLVEPDQLLVQDDAEALLSSQQLQSRLALWIDGYYNHERRHTTIGYLSPIDYEKQFVRTRKLESMRP